MGIFDNKAPNERQELNGYQPVPRHDVISDEWQIGDWIGGTNFQVREVKKGGMGVIYVVWDEVTTEKRAIKTYRKDFFFKPETIDMFVKEANIWVNLERHTNVVRADLVLTLKGKPHVVMEYVAGGDLSQYIGKLDVTHSIDFAIQLCTGMDYAYKKLGIVHRDIKPQNALITSDRVLKVADFGLSASVEQSQIIGQENGDPVLSRGMGMPPEQFPEQIQKQYQYGPEQVTTRSDVYSFGVTLYEMLTSKLPFSNIEQIFRRAAVNPKIVNASVPQSLDLLTMKCLEKVPNRRYESFDQLIKVLVGIYEALPPQDRLFGKNYVIKEHVRPLTADEWCNKGYSLAELLQYEEAVICYNKALEINPRQAVAWNNRGSALGKLGQYTEALLCFNKAIEIHSGYAQAWFNKAAALERLGMKSEAADCRKLGEHCALEHDQPG